MTNRIEINPADRDRIKLRLTGDNNTVIVKKLSDATGGKISVSLAGNNCTVVLDEAINIGEAVNIYAGQIHPNFGMIENTHIYVGKGTSFEKTVIATANSNSSIEIGERCMFSYGITVFNTDMHPIVDAENGNIVNKVKTLKIGDHVWVGANSTILKNTVIPDNCIVGWGSVVNSKSLPPPPLQLSGNTAGCVIAGNPAKIVKTGVAWDADGSKGYVQNAGVSAQISERAAAIVALPPENAYTPPKSKKRGLMYRLWKHLSKKYGGF